MAKVFSQMSEVAENSIGVVFGYHIVAGMLALVVLPGLPLLDGSLLWGAMGAIVAALLVMMWFVRGLMKSDRLAWFWGRYLMLFGFVVRFILMIAFGVMASQAGAQGYAVLPSGAVGALLAAEYGGTILPMFGLWFFLLDLTVTFAGLVGYMTMGNKKSLAHFDLICPECNTMTKKAADFLFKRAQCRACKHTW
ncbi:MAG: hypothetical protein IID44_27770 [Planctomycetes bacterium]|nr:hypothetical protein [Planctomycetota bacterium]